MITSLGVGSGLDVESLVTQLMEIEEAPLLSISTRQLGLQTEISSIGQLKAAMSGLRSAMAGLGQEAVFRSTGATSSDEEVVTATAGPGAGTGDHAIDVTQLAQAHRIGSEAFADADTTPLGTGVVTIASGDSSIVVPIGPGNNTLQGIRDSINGSPVNGIVDASVLNTDDGARLILTARETGAVNTLTVSVSGDIDGDDTDAAGISRLTYTPDAVPPVARMSELSEALDAEFTVDTFAVSRPGNTIDDVLEGVTMELLTEGEATVSVSGSSSEAVAAADAIVEAYNGLRETLATLRQGELQGDSLLLGIENQIRDLFASRQDNGFTGIGTAFEAGFSFNDEGVMSLDALELVDAMNSNMDAVIEFFADTGTGFVTRMDAVIESYVGAGAVLDRRTDSLREADGRLELRVASLESRLVRTEERIRAQFSALDTLVANLEVTNNFLLAQLDGLPFSNLGNQ